MRKHRKNTTTENKREHADMLKVEGIAIPKDLYDEAVKIVEEAEEVLDASEAVFTMADGSVEIKKDEADDSVEKASETFEEVNETAAPSQEDLNDQEAPAATEEGLKEKAETLPPAEPSDKQEPSPVTSKATLAEMLKEKMSTLAITEDASETSEISTISAMEPLTTPISDVSIKYMLPKEMTQRDGCYCIRGTNDRLTEITNFTFTDVCILTKTNIRGESEQLIKASVVTDTGKKAVIDAKARDFNTTSAFNNVLDIANAEYNAGLVFKGRQAHLSVLKQLVLNFEGRAIEATSVIGTFHTKDGKNVFVSKEGCINADGNVCEDALYVGDSILKTDLIDYINSTLTEDEFITVINNLFALNTLNIIAVLLAWASACFIKSPLSALGKSFPPLVINGEPGGGKTTTVRNIIKPIFCMEDTVEVTANSSSSFGMMKTLTDSQLIPFILDEVKFHSANKDDSDVVSKLLRDVYDEHANARGNKNRSLDTYKLSAPFIAIGENYITNIANNERMINVSISKNARNGKNKKIHSINAEGGLNKLGGMLLKAALNTSQETVNNWYTEGANRYGKTFTDRNKNKAACCYAGICLLLSLKCDDTGRSLEDLINDHKTAFRTDDLFQSIETTILCSIPEDGTSITDIMLGAMINDEEIRERYFRVDIPSREIYIWIDKAIDHLRLKMIKLRRTDEITDNTTFKKYLANSCYFKGKNKSKRINGDTVKAWVLDLDKVKANIDISSLLPDNQ